MWAKVGHVNERGRPFHHKSVRAMLDEWPPGEATMHIEIVKHPIKGPIKGYEVRVVDANGRLIRMFTYPTIESARRAAKAWTAAYGNCPIRDKSGVQE